MVKLTLFERDSECLQYALYVYNIYSHTHSYSFTHPIIIGFVFSLERVLLIVKCIIYINISSDDRKTCAPTYLSAYDSVAVEVVTMRGNYYHW